MPTPRCQPQHGHGRNAGGRTENGGGQDAASAGAAIAPSPSGPHESEKSSRQRLLGILCISAGGVLNCLVQLWDCLYWHESHPWSIRLETVIWSLAGPLQGFISLLHNPDVVVLIVVLAACVLLLEGIACCLVKPCWRNFAISFVSAYLWVQVGRYLAAV